MVKVCSICGITSNEKLIKNHPDYGLLCNKHYGQIMRHGRITDPTARTTHDKNEIVIVDDYAEIIITDKKNNEVARALIDIDDIDKCREHKWELQKGYIASINPCKRKRLKLHRLIMNYYDEKDIDHRNHNPLDNRKKNLRVVDKTVNNANRKSAKLIYLQPNGKYKVQIQRYGLRFTKSGFKTEEEAIEWRDKTIEEIENNAAEYLKEYKEARKNPTTGVFLLPSGRWRAEYHLNNHKYNVGTFDTKEEAYLARQAALNNLTKNKSA